MNTKMNLKNIQIPSSQTVISTAASVAATAMLVRSLARDYIPSDLQNYVLSKFRSFFTKFSTQVTLVFDEFVGFSNNHVFNAVEIYLRPTLSHGTKRFRVIMPKKEKKIALVMGKNQEMVDTFKGVQLKWRSVSQQIKGKYISSSETGRYNYILKSELRYFELSFNRTHKNMVLNEYLPYVLQKSKEVKEERKTLKIFTLPSGRMIGGGICGMGGSLWQSANLDHPATFDTLAMDLEMKKMIKEDLDKFVSRKEFYRKVGKAWKRGYLLFGPPGTGKSSLIAAMANYLNFNVYDLELKDVKRNSDLRKLLITTGNRSILVVEDIDCSIDLRNRATEAIVTNPNPFSKKRAQVTLSGLLNFVDGLWSSCGDERIIVFTTNHKEKLDPALVRPGRMDMHIHMSFCTPCGFKLLASNYLQATNHPLMEQIEKMIETVNVTPAEVGEQMLKYEDSELALNSLIDFLREKKRLGTNGSFKD